MMRALPLLVAALLALSCTSTPPQPTDRGQPTGAPSATPAQTGPLPTGVRDVGDAGNDLLRPDDLLKLPGIYVPAGTVGRGSDHYAFIQSPADCDSLRAVLSAGEWAVSDEVSPPMPTPDPEAGIPELPPIQWLMLRWADEMALARLGGDDASCVAQVWRIAHVPYAASGAFESAGEARQLQLLCFAAAGYAQIGALYLASDGVVYSLGASMPLEVGSHPLDENMDVAIGTSELDIGTLFPILFGGGMGDGFDVDDSLTGFFPADPESGEWQGSVNVTSVEPLAGEIVLEDLRDAAGRGQSLRSGFRCDLPPGQLTRAAEALADDEPSPSPAPPSRLKIDISAGPHAGIHEVESSEVSCSFDLLGDDSWFITYSPEADPRPGELAALMLTVPADGGRSSAFMMFGDSPDWFDTDRATGQVADSGDTADVVVSGRESGVEFQITMTCGAVERP